MSLKSNLPIRNPPQLLIYIISDIDPFTIRKKQLYLPAESSFGHFRQMVAEHQWAQHIINTSIKAEHRRPLLYDDDIRPYKDDIATPEGGCPYFEWLKDWNGALRAVRPEDIEAGWFKPISPRTWRSIERDYYKGHNIGNKESAKVGRSIADFHKSRSLGFDYDDPKKGWSSLLIKKNGPQPPSEPDQQAGWVPIDDEADWQSLKKALKHESALGAEMMHRSTWERIGFLRRRHQMEVAIQEAGGMVPVANFAALPDIEDLQN